MGVWGFEFNVLSYTFEAVQSFSSYVQTHSFCQRPLGCPFSHLLRQYEAGLYRPEACSASERDLFVEVVGRWKMGV